MKYIHYMGNNHCFVGVYQILLMLPFKHHGLTQFSLDWMFIANWLNSCLMARHVVRKWASNDHMCIDLEFKINFVAY